MRASRPPARLVAGLAGAVALLALAPATASALTCSRDDGLLGAFEQSHAAFVGEVVERRDETAVVSILEGFKGVPAGDVAELFVGRYSPGDWNLRAAVGDIVSGFAVRRADGLLQTGPCRGASPDALRLTAALAAQGWTCAGTQARIVRVTPTVRGREIQLRVVLASGRERANTVRVFWGGQPGVERNAQTVARVPRSRALRLRHRYPRAGVFVVRVALEPQPLCTSWGAPIDVHDLRVRLRPARRS